MSVNSSAVTKPATAKRGFFSGVVGFNFWLASIAAVGIGAAVV